MRKKEDENIRTAKKLTDEETKAVTGGMKIVVENPSSWWRTIIDFFFKKKS